jgi:predicted NUDIX family NTP pyrophosphohydrolase
VPEAKIDSIDPLILYCKSMVYPINSEPFPEVDAFRWFPLDVAIEILYQPQKAILPDLLSIIQKLNQV